MTFKNDQLAGDIIQLYEAAGSDTRRDEGWGMSSLILGKIFATLNGILNRTKRGQVQGALIWRIVPARRAISRYEVYYGTGG